MRSACARTRTSSRSITTFEAICRTAIRSRFCRKPFEGQGPKGSVMRFPFLPLLLVTRAPRHISSSNAPPIHELFSCFCFLPTFPLQSRQDFVFAVETLPVGIALSGRQIRTAGCLLAFPTMPRRAARSKTASPISTATGSRLLWKTLALNNCYAVTIREPAPDGLSDLWQNSERNAY
jgi:hypothetical protein